MKKKPKIIDLIELERFLDFCKKTKEELNDVAKFLDKYKNKILMPFIESCYKKNYFYTQLGAYENKDEAWLNNSIDLVDFSFINAVFTEKELSYILDHYFSKDEYYKPSYDEFVNRIKEYINIRTKEVSEAYDKYLNKLQEVAAKD